MLSLRHWQVFIILILGYVLSIINITGEPFYTTLVKSIGFLIYFSYPIAIAHNLQAYVHETIKLKYNFFIFNVFIWVSTYLVAAIISEGGGVTFNGIYAIPVLYFFFAFIQVLAFPAKSIKSIEIGREAKLSEYIGYFILFLFLPIGIWIIQPKINKIIAE